MNNFKDKLKGLATARGTTSVALTAAVIAVVVAFNAVIYALTSLLGLYIYTPYSDDLSLSGATDELFAEAIGKELQIDEVYSELSPDGKYEILARIMKEGKCAYVGDGINDAPSLALADVGIAMGGAGTDSAIETADLVITSDDLSRISDAIVIAKRTLAIARFNIVFALAVKIGVMLLGALGLAGMWLAVFADVGVAVIAILISMQTLLFARSLR